VVGRALVRIQHIGLVNVVAGRKIVSELVQGDANAVRMAAEVAPLLTDPALREAKSRDLLDVRSRLGDPGASDRVARMVLDMIGGVE
jgi:lipid-A-disaccharide synthase